MASKWAPLCVYAVSGLSFDLSRVISPEPQNSAYRQINLGFNVIASLRTLLDGIVDYAGLFPPAKLPMDKAVEEYNSYLTDPHRFMLARFVLPATELFTFAAIAEPHFRKDPSNPWKLSALIGSDAQTDMDRIEEFNNRYTPLGALVDVTEMRADTKGQIITALQIVPPTYQRFVEIPVIGDPTLLISTVKENNAYAKIRTGGVTQNAFPDAADVAHFIIMCRSRNLAFKATAGLHHPIRAEYRLTYDPDPPKGMMYGYLNIFVAAILAWVHAPEELIFRALLETDAANFKFDSEGLTYNDQRIYLSEINEARERFIISFGSCSFREPVDDLADIGLR